MKNTKEEYFTFCTPECAKQKDAYFEYNTRPGEKLTKDSYFIREQSDVNDLEQVRKHDRPISIKTISNVLLSISVKAGLRKVNHNFNYRERESVPIIHGF